jgi:hypothetical protein
LAYIEFEMRRLAKSLAVALLIFGMSGCAAQGKREREEIVEQAAIKFYQQLNQEQYSEIYQAADPTLKANIAEAVFVEKLREAHTQIGTVSKRPNVFSRGGIGQAIKRIFSDREVFIHVELQSTDLIYATERFTWEYSGGKALLASYEFKTICTKPCAIGIGKS